MGLSVFARHVRRLAAPALLTAALAGAAVVGAVAPAAAEMVLNRGNQAEPSSLDPHKGTDMQSARIGYDLFEGLLTFGPDGALVPGAAESWTISDDGTVYTFKLREDGRWSDGSPVTAEDFAYAWRRLVDPKTASDYAYFLWPVKNAEAISRGQMPVESMGVEAVDDRTLKVTLEEPTGYFLSSLVHRMTYPVSKKNFEALGNEAVTPGKLLSNGAFMLVEHLPQSHVTVVKNPHFRAADTVKLDKVVFHHTDSPDTELRRFRAGELDTLQQAPVTQVDWLRQNMPESVFFYPVFATNYLALNHSREPWASNPKLRQALYLAIDREAIVEKITRSGERPAFGFTAPGAPGYTGPEIPAAKMTQAEREQLAKQLLAEAGYGPGGKQLEIELLHNTNETTRKVMVGVAAMWSKVLGAKVTLNNQEWKVMLQTAGEKAYPGAVILGWIGDFPDPYTFLKLGRSDVGKMNRSGYASEKFDALLTEANLITDPAARAAKLAEAEAVLIQDVGMLPIYHATYRNLVSPRVKGWFANPQGVQPSRYITVER